MALSKESKHSLESVTRGLARGDAEMALAGYAKLPPASRVQHAAPVATLVAARLAHHRARAEWANVVPFAKRLEADPTLLAAVEPGARVEALWSLTWGCGLSGEWLRARRFWSELAVETEAAAPLLAETMSLWVTTQGRPVLPTTVAARFSPDPRLGVEPVRAQGLGPEAPVRLDDVEATVLAARTAGSATAFAAWVERVASKADGALATRVREVAQHVALRDLLIDLEAGKALPEAPLALFASCGESAAGTTADALIVLQLCLRAIERNQPVSPRALRSVVARCADDNSMMPLVREALVGMAVRQEAFGGPQGLHLLGEALEVLALREPLLSASVWATAIVVQERHADLRARRPERRHGRPQKLQQRGWIVASTADVLSRASGLGAWLCGADHRARQLVLETVAEGMPLDQAQRFLEVAANEGNAEVRAALVPFVRDLLARVSESFCYDCGVVHRSENGSPAWSSISAPGRALWEGIEETALSLVYADFLRLALERDATAPRRRKLLDRYLDTAATATDWAMAIDVLASIRGLRQRAHLETLVARLIAQHAHDLRGLFGALSFVFGQANRPNVFLPLVRAIIEASDRCTTPLTRREEDLLRVARRAVLDSDRHAVKPTPSGGSRPAQPSRRAAAPTRAGRKSTAPWPTKTSNTPQTEPAPRAAAKKAASGEPATRKEAAAQVVFSFGDLS